MSRNKGVVHLYAMCFNERQMIPYFLRHYGPLVDRFFIYDNGSTDGSLELLKGDERVETRHFTTSPTSFVETAQGLVNQIWKSSRGSADWVVLVEVDEHLHHLNLADYLAHCAAQGVTAVRAIGYEMTSTTFTEDPSPLCTQITTGYRAPELDKLSIFDPDAVAETNFGVGRHYDRPVGRIILQPFRQVKLLHYKYLGVDYVCGRNAILSKGLRDKDVEKGWGRQYFADRSKVEADLTLLRRLSRRVAGLGQSTLFDCTMEDERRLIQQSGYFDSAFYVNQYSDISKSDDSLLHFCCFGWDENRNPNKYFDMGWYRKTYGALIPPGVNALLHYILLGRQEDWLPSIGFDPRFYRMENALPPGADALGHCLRQKGLKAQVSRYLAKRRAHRRGVRSRWKWI